MFLLRKMQRVKGNNMASNQKFDFQNLHELNMPLKLGLGVVIILFILGLGYFLSFQDQ